MWYFACIKCGTFVRVSGDAEEFLRLIMHHVMWKTRRPCFTYGCDGEMQGVTSTMGGYAVRMYDLDPQQFFRALCGGGAPEEIEIRPEVVRAFLLSSKIIKVDTHEMVGDHRVVIDRLHLDNDTVLHFAGTAAGAMIYKVTKDVQARDQVGVRPETEDGALRREAEGLPAEAGSVAGDASSPDGHLPGCCHELDAGGGPRVPGELPHCGCGGHQGPTGEPVPRRAEDDGNVAASVDGVDP